MEHLDIDDCAKSLELFGNSEGALFKLLNHCKTSGGKKLLEEWLRKPLRNLQEIEERLDQVEYFKESAVVRTELGSALSKLPDLGKLKSKFSEGKGRLEDCAACFYFASVALEVNEILEGHQFYSQELSSAAKNLFKLKELVQRAIDFESFKKDKTYRVNPNFDEELLEIDNQIKEYDQQIEELRQSLSMEMQLSKELKLVDSLTHLYLFEGSKTEIYNAKLNNPSLPVVVVTHRQKTSTINCPDLKNFSRAKSQALKRYQEGQAGLVTKVIDLVGSYSPLLEQMETLFSHIDCIVSLAHSAQTASIEYTRPKFTERIYLKGCRHPVLEAQGSCVPNNCQLDSKTLMMITGPNMGGKSTYLKQVAITVILAHMGSMVPCEVAEVVLLDSVVARVGAGDIQVKGVSTFMKEMLEVSSMLEKATGNSLVILDELGRGTTTSEGIGIAWAIAEELANRGTYTLFATHFSELTELKHPRVSNFHTDVSFQNGLTMMYKVEEGPMDASYGIEIAKLAGMPDSVISTSEGYKNKLLHASNF